MDDDERRQTYKRLIAGLLGLRRVHHPFEGAYVLMDDVVVMLADELLSERRQAPTKSLTSQPVDPDG